VIRKSKVCFLFLFRHQTLTLTLGITGVPVYQTSLPHANTTRVLLRRLDTDFVNLTHLLVLLRLVLPHASPQRHTCHPPKSLRQWDMGAPQHRAPLLLQMPRHPLEGKRGGVPERRARYAFPERVEGFLES
jgi:hypothetical protein